MSFTEQLKAASEHTQTLNGDLSYTTTQNPVLDLFSLGASARTMSEEAISRLVLSSYENNRVLTMRCLFYIRDIRGGQGERRFFRVALKALTMHYQLYVNTGSYFDFLQLIPRYGRWDDLFEIFELEPIQEFLKRVLFQELESLEVTAEHSDLKISLLAKWMPSLTSGTASRKQALKLCELWEMKHSDYRKMLSKLRAHLKIVERPMSANSWSEVDYAHVPSQAARIYRNAFKRHDGERYTTYLEKVESGEAKINAATLFPYQIIASYLDKSHEMDITLEALWNNLPDYCQNYTDNSLVMADTSGSMCGLPLAISLSLAIYMAERNRGTFKNYFMTFSSKPQMVRLIGQFLISKLTAINQINENTNVVAGFYMLLKFAIENETPPEEMPKTIYIISDMQFDANGENEFRTTFQVLKETFAKCGYALPRIVFWVVNAAGGIQFPVRKDDINTILVSGASPVTFKMVTSGNFTTPESYMLSILNSERYACIN